MSPSPHGPSGEKHFGLLFSFCFSLLAAHFYWKAAIVSVSIVAALAGIVFLFFALFKPVLLGPLNRTWHRLGVALGRIVSPMVLGAIFFFLLTPIAMLMRAFGRDVLRLHSRSGTAPSYWVRRDHLNPDPTSFKNQF
jgi:hypothetical protein